jgi:hypothetical protein
MQWLNRVPIWGWFLFTYVLVFATWNPTGYSLFEYIGYSDGEWSSRVLVGVVLMALYALYLHETYLTFNVVGLGLFLAIVAAFVWKAVDWGMMSVASTSVWQWLVPTVIAFLLTLGLQGNRIYRNATGRIPVSVDHHGHDGHQDQGHQGGHHG